MWREEGKVCNFSLMAARFSWFNWQLDFIIVAMVKVTPPSAEGNLSVHNSISSAWAKTEWRVYRTWEDYSNVNFLQTHLMSSLIPALQGFMTAGLFNLLILLGVLMSAFWVHCAKVLWKSWQLYYPTHACEERSGEVSSQQDQGDNLHTGQPLEWIRQSSQVFSHRMVITPTLFTIFECRAHRKQASADLKRTRRVTTDQLWRSLVALGWVRTTGVFAGSWYQGIPCMLSTLFTLNVP